MAIEWKAQANSTVHWWAFERGRIVGEVVTYDDADTHRPYWAAFARGDRIPGRFATVDEAKAAVESV